jgi:hypothetical protein
MQAYCLQKEQDKALAITCSLTCSQAGRRAGKAPGVVKQELRTLQEGMQHVLVSFESWGREVAPLPKDRLGPGRGLAIRCTKLFQEPKDRYRCPGGHCDGRNPRFANALIRGPNFKRELHGWKARWQDFLYEALKNKKDPGPLPLLLLPRATRGASAPCACCGCSSTASSRTE